MASTPPSPACNSLSLLELAERSMAQSLLVFLLADLRILSATGRIQTKYEHVALDSDHSHRSALEFAGATLPRYKSRGVTPAHVVALLILEIQYHVNTNHRDQTDEVWNKAFIKSAEDMPSLLRSYQEMVASDLNTSFQVRKEDFPLEENASCNGTEEGNEYFKKSEFDPQIAGADGPEDSEDLFGDFKARLPESRPQLLRRVDRRGKLMLEELVDQMTSSSIREQDTNTPAKESEHYTKEELITLLEQSIETRDASRLKCISKLFKPKSIMRILVDSPTEIVWLQDWHTQYECTYAIAVNHESRHVVLAFRGAYTFNDWSHAADWNYKTTSNPIPENYPNKSKNIKLHGGFHKYLFRVRKDTGTVSSFVESGGNHLRGILNLFLSFQTKYDEISSKVAQYCALVGEGYTVTITGHSLGAALTTVMALYASTEERFTRNGPITAVTWGGPYVGGYQLAAAVRHQESTCKLRLARFHNVGDGVPHLPLALFALSKKGAKHHHVGMNVRLPMIRKGVFRAFGQPQPSVSYNGPPKSFCRSVLRQWNVS